MAGEYIIPFTTDYGTVNTVDEQKTQHPSPAGMDEPYNDAIK